LDYLCRGRLFPSTDGDTATVEHTAQDKQQPLIRNGAQTFKWSPGAKIEDGEEDATITQDKEDIAEVIQGAKVGANEVFVHDEANEPNSGKRFEDGHDKEIHKTIVEENKEGHRREHDASSNDKEDKVNNAGPDIEETQTKTEEFVDKEPGDHESVDEDLRSEGQIIHNLRPNRKRDYSNQLGHIMDNPASNKSYNVQNGQGLTPELREAVEVMHKTGYSAKVFKCMTGIMMMMMMMTAKAGIKKHRQVAIDAQFQEFSQLHDLEVFRTRDENKVTKKEKEGALRAISMERKR
jgi:hypothetical protein